MEGDGRGSLGFQDLYYDLSCFLVGEHPAAFHQEIDRDADQTQNQTNNQEKWYGRGLLFFQFDFLFKHRCYLGGGELANLIIV